MAEAINIPQTSSVEELIKTLNVALNRLSIRIDDGQIATDLDLTNHQIKNVSRPTQDQDAVNVAYLREQLGNQPATSLNRRQQYRLQTGGTGTGGGTGTSPPEWIHVESTMTVGTTTVPSLFAPSAGKYYAIVLYQDGTGGRVVDWGTATAFKGMAGWQPDTTPSTFSSFLFYCKASNNFQLLAPPVTGVS